jgi:hypothetical protein
MKTSRVKKTNLLLELKQLPKLLLPFCRRHFPRKSNFVEEFYPFFSDIVLLSLLAASIGYPLFMNPIA